MDFIFQVNSFVLALSINWRRRSPSGLWWVHGFCVLTFLTMWNDTFFLPCLLSCSVQSNLKNWLGHTRVSISIYGFWLSQQNNNHKIKNETQPKSLSFLESSELRGTTGQLLCCLLDQIKKCHCSTFQYRLLTMLCNMYACHFSQEKNIY